MAHHVWHCGLAAPLAVFRGARGLREAKPPVGRSTLELYLTLTRLLRDLPP